MSVNKKMKKAVSILLCLCMLAQNAPLAAFAAADDNLCQHHPVHTPECHYAEASAGSDCTHSHDELCGYAEPVAEVPCACTETDETGALVHTEGCGYVAAVAGSDCAHVHDDACGYAEAVAGHECHYECAECETSPAPSGGTLPKGEGNAVPSGEDVSPAGLTEEALCTCGTDDEAYHATTCAVYVRPEAPQCFCAEKCTEANIWCDVCGFDYTKCGGIDTALTWAGVDLSSDTASAGNNRGTWYLNPDNAATEFYNLIDDKLMLGAYGYVPDRTYITTNAYDYRDGLGNDGFLWTDCKNQTIRDGRYYIYVFSRNANLINRIEYIVDVQVRYTVNISVTGAPSGYGGVTLNGSNAGSPQYLHKGGSITLTVKDVPSHKHTVTYDNSVTCSQNGDTYAFSNVNKSFTFKVVYEADEFATVSFVQPEGATISVNGNSTSPVQVTAGMPYTVSVKTNDGYYLTGITVDGTTTSLDTTSYNRNLTAGGNGAGHTISVTTAKVAIPVNTMAIITYTKNQDKASLVNAIKDAVYAGSDSKNSLTVNYLYFGDTYIPISDSTDIWESVFTSRQMNSCNVKESISVKLSLGDVYSPACTLYLYDGDISANGEIRKDYTEEPVKLDGSDFSFAHPANFSSSYPTEYRYFTESGQRLSSAPTEVGKYQVQVKASSYHTNPGAILGTSWTSWSGLIPFEIVSVPTYSITVENSSDGSVTASKETSIAGKTVTLTVKPNAGYLVGTVSCNGTVITPVDGVYSFTMPAGAVTVSATFVACEHTGGEATCTEQAVCTVCGESYGEPLGHSTTAEGDRAATCTAPAYCSVCESEYGELADHNWNTTGYCPTCSTQAEARVTSNGADTYYGTLMAALEASGSGDTVTLCANVDLGTTRHTIPAGVTFKGGEYSVSGSGAGWLANKGTIENGAFQFMAENRGTVKGGTFAGPVDNYGTITGGSFHAVFSRPLSTLSGNFRFDTLHYQEASTVDLSEAARDGAMIVNSGDQELTAGSLKLPEGYALELNGNVVSGLPTGATGHIVTHSHSYEPKFNDTHHWTVCACGKATVEAEHSFTYTANGDNHTLGCSGCGYTGSEGHTPDDTIGQTCKGSWCTDCESWYGEPDLSAHVFASDNKTCKYCQEIIVAKVTQDGVVSYYTAIEDVVGVEEQGSTNVVLTLLANYTLKETKNLGFMILKREGDVTITVPDGCSLIVRNINNSVHRVDWIDCVGYRGRTYKNRYDIYYENFENVNGNDYFLLRDHTVADASVLKGFLSIAASATLTVTGTLDVSGSGADVYVAGKLVLADNAAVTNAAVIRINGELDLGENATITNRGTILLADTTVYKNGYDIPGAITGGTVIIDGITYTYVPGGTTDEKDTLPHWTCSDHMGLSGATCTTPAHCQNCGDEHEAYGDHSINTATGNCLYCGAYIAVATISDGTTTLHAREEQVRDLTEQLLNSGSRTITVVLSKESLLDDVTLAVSRSVPEERQTVHLTVRGVTSISEDSGFMGMKQLASLSLPDVTYVFKDALIGTYLERLELTAEGRITLERNIIDSNYINSVKLVLCCNKAKDVSDGVYWNGFTFRSVTYTKHNYVNGVCTICGETCVHSDQDTTVTDNGDGTHKKVCNACGYEEAGAEHSLAFTIDYNIIHVVCSADCGYSGTASVNAFGKVYDGKPAEVSVATDGDLAGTTFPITYAVKDGGTLPGAPVDAGEYTASISMGGNGNTVAASMHFTILKAAPVIVAAPTPNDLTYNGEGQYLISPGEAAGGEMHYSTDGQTWSATIPLGTDAGKYTVYYKVAGDQNHTDTAVDSVEVTIARAQAVITVDTTPITVTYGETVKLPTAATNLGTVVCDKTAADIQNAGTHTVTYTVASTPNIVGAEKKLTVTVEKRPVEEPTVIGTYTYTGEEHTVVLRGVQNCMTILSGNKATNAGHYQVELALDGNHKWADGFDGKLPWAIARGKAEIRVNTAPITVTYGDALKLPAATSNFGTVVCDKTPADLVSAGTYTVTYSVADAPNFTGDTATVTVTVNPRPITVKADAVSKIYGEADPELTYTVEGLVTGDALSGALTREEGTDVGTYSITQGTLTGGSNYRISFTGARLTVNPKAITASDVKLLGSHVYNGTQQTQEITVKTGITYRVTGNTATDAGAYTLTVTGTGNYTGSADVEWRIARAEVTITPDSKVIYLGEALPALTCTVTGLVSGETLAAQPTLATGADQTKAGSYTITASGAEASENYTIVYRTGTLTIMDKDTPVDTRIHAAQLTVVPDGLTDTRFNTVAAIQQELARRIAAISLGYTGQNMIHYDVALQFSLDGGRTWIPATGETFPTEGVTVTLPYPAGTNAANFDFAVSHMFTVTSRRLGTNAGDVELPRVTETAEGIRVTLKGLSPVTLAWKATEYDVDIASTTNGTVAASATKATRGTEVAITVTPKSGYKLATLTVKDDAGNSCVLATDSTGRYYFAMPADDVTVTATFTKTSSSIADPTNPKSGDDSRPVLWSGILCASALAMAALLADNRRRKYSK